MCRRRRLPPAITRRTAPRSFPDSPPSRHPAQFPGAAVTRPRRSTASRRSTGSAYGQPPYGYPGASPFAAAPKATNGLAVTALVLGILALVLCWIPFFDAVFIIPGIIFGILGISAAKRRGGIGQVMGIMGLCLSLVAAVACIAISAWAIENLHCTTIDNGSGDTSTHCTLDNN